MMNQKHSQINIVLHNQSNQPSTHEQTIMPLIDQTFSAFVGMDELKRTIQQIYATKDINGRREQIGLNCKDRKSVVWGKRKEEGGRARSRERKETRQAAAREANE